MSDDKKSARKYWWIIMLIPIGLAVGTVTSLVNHLSKNKEEEAQEQFKVAVELNAKDIENALKKSLIFGKRNLDSEIGLSNTESVKRFIQGDVSPGGTGQQWQSAKIATTQNKTIKLSYTDIVGSNEDDIVAVVIELVSEKSKADASKIAITPAIIRSLLKEKPLSTIRFVLTPITQSANTHAEDLKRVTLKYDQKLLHTIVLKEQETVELSDVDDWKDLHSNTTASQLITNGETNLEITHSVLRRAEISDISPQHGQSTLDAAAQLRALILKAAN